MRVHPDPDADATTDADAGAREPEWTRERTRRAAEESAVLAVGDDAAAVDADRTRPLLPETPRHVTEAAAAGVELADHPDFVLEAPL